jgi:hypothetical protein
METTPLPIRPTWEHRLQAVLAQNVAHMQISPATMKRMKHARQQAQTPPPPPPQWRFYERHHPHSSTV